MILSIRTNLSKTGEADEEGEESVEIVEAEAAPEVGWTSDQLIDQSDPVVAAS